MWFYKYVMSLNFIRYSFLKSLPLPFYAFLVRLPCSPRPAAAAGSSYGEPLRLHIYRLLRKGLVVIIVVCIVNLIFSFVFRTPKANRIAAERDELLLRMEALDDRIRAAQPLVD